MESLYLLKLVMNSRGLSMFLLLFSIKQECRVVCFIFKSFNDTSSIFSVSKVVNQFPFIVFKEDLRGCVAY